MSIMNNHQYFMSAKYQSHYANRQQSTYDAQNRNEQSLRYRQQQQLQPQQQQQQQPSSSSSSSSPSEHYTPSHHMNITGTTTMNGYISNTQSPGPRLQSLQQQPPPPPQSMPVASTFESRSAVFQRRPTVSPEPSINRNYNSTCNNSTNITTTNNNNTNIPTTGINSITNTATTTTSSSNNNSNMTTNMNKNAPSPSRFSRNIPDTRDPYGALPSTSTMNVPGPSRYHRSPSPHNFLTPQRAELMSGALQIGVLSPSTPPISRQRRHSKLNLRIAGGMSVDHGDGPPIYQPTPASTLNTSTANVSNSSPSSSSPSSTPATVRPPRERYRIVIMGSSAVGKTAIVEQFLYGSFPETHCATVEELHKGEYEISGGSAIPLEILDTSGSFEFPAMRRLAISTGDAFALIYSIDSQTSFEEVKNMREMILQVKGTDPIPPPIVVVGNKCDLAERRRVKMEAAECECIDWDVGFVECSAKDNLQIVNIFSCMLIQARLKGTLNVAQLASGSSSNSRHIGYRDPTEQARSRRRSSLPIVELFTRFPRSNPDSRAASAASHHSGSASFRKRNSCTPS